MLDRLADELGPDLPLRAVHPAQLEEAARHAWAHAAPRTWNRNRGALCSFLRWARRHRLDAPAAGVPLRLEHRREPADRTRAIPFPQLERLWTRDSMALPATPPRLLDGAERQPSRCSAPGRWIRPTDRRAREGSPMSITSAGAARAGSSRRRGRAVLAALPDPREQEQLAQLGACRAQEALDAAAAAGAPLLDPTGRRRSPVTLPEYRQGRAPANKGRRYPVEVLTPDEVRAILDVVPGGPTGVRNRALIVVLWRAGLRIAEALALLPKDVVLDGNAVTVLDGKGAKRRVAAIDRSACRYVEAWLSVRAKAGAGADDPLFCVVHKGLVGEPLNSASFRESLKGYARKAGVAKRVHPHGFRHTHAFELSQEDVPVQLIQAQLGHEDLAMTARYIDHLNPKQLLSRIGGRSWPGEIAPPEPQTVAARSDVRSVPHEEPSCRPRHDPPEPKPSPSRGTPAPGGEGAQRVLDAIAANGGSATQGQLRRALGLTGPSLLKQLHKLHDQERIIRAGFDRNRSIIWKVAPPPVVLRRRVSEYRYAPPGDGPKRVLDAVETLGGRASQAELGRLLGLATNTVHDHCLALAAEGLLERGGLDKSTSRRGSQVWKVPPVPSRYHYGGFSRQFTLPARAPH